jgi:hypothetical protein
MSAIENVGCFARAAILIKSLIERWKRRMDLDNTEYAISNLLIAVHCRLVAPSVVYLTLRKPNFRLSDDFHF